MSADRFRLPAADSTRSAPFGRISPYESKTRVDGASFLLWALAGADLLGTPGFQDLNGNGTWADDTGTTCRPVHPRRRLHALIATRNPIYPRSGPSSTSAR